MFVKVLKHDFKFMFKYWPIAAAATLLLTAIGSACMVLLKLLEKEQSNFLRVVGTLGLILAIAALGIIALFSTIMSCVRYYKNFFTDEGYLTFTLPVKKTDLLLSKVVSSVILQMASGVVIAINIAILILVGLGIGFIKYHDIMDFFDGFAEVLAELGEYSFIYFVEGILASVVLSVASILFLFTCITIGAMIAKKAKLVASIGVYYVANIILSGITNVLYFGILFGIDGILSKIAPDDLKFIVANAFFVVIVFFAIIASLLFTIINYILDKKLNLA